MRHCVGATLQEQVVVTRFVRWDDGPTVADTPVDRPAVALSTSGSQMSSRMGVALSKSERTKP